MAQDTGLAQGNLIWIDLEMTGLDTERDYIIEIATVVTDGHLNVIAEGPVLIVHQTAEILNGMDAWNKAQHSKTGLIDRVLSSRTNEADAERMTLDFLKKYVLPNKSPMCGNSICQDRRFLHRGMPELERFFHYRHIDVSTVKELAHRWVPNIATAYTKESSHRALDDIHESIRELKYYREHLFKMP